MENGFTGVLVVRLNVGDLHGDVVVRKRVRRYRMEVFFGGGGREGRGLVRCEMYGDALWRSYNKLVMLPEAAIFFTKS